jgi:hypothetical protein
VPKASWRVVLAAYRFHCRETGDMYKRRKVGLWRTRR